MYVLYAKTVQPLILDTSMNRYKNALSLAILLCWLSATMAIATEIGSPAKSGAARFGFDVSKNNYGSSTIDRNYDDSEIYPAGYSRNKPYWLKTDRSTGHSFSSIIVLIEPDGTGHLQLMSTNATAKQTSSPKVTLLSWDERLGENKTAVSKSALSFDSLKRLFGTPRPYPAGKLPKFYTFDARTEKSPEEDLYHLDFKFDAHNRIEEYRIRGIGVTNPRWIRNPKLDPSSPQM
jgi:hypothetical protein